MSEWQAALRFLWNIAHEQRLMGLARTSKRYPTAFDQINDLTDLRADLPWLAAVPRNVSAQILVQLDRAWQCYFAGIFNKPRWKSKDKDLVGLTEPHSEKWRLSGSELNFPKLGKLRTVVHRPLIGKPKTCTLSKDGDQWFASIICEISAPDPEPRVGPIVAIDRGVTNTIACSDGQLIKNPKHRDVAQKRLAHAQRVLNRRQKGSRRRAKAKARVVRLHQKIRRQREHFLHVQSSRLVKNHGIIVIEKLNIEGMKRGVCSGGLVGAGLSRFAEMLRYKLAMSGGTLIEVPAHYSSQTCSACGHVDARSRHRERFSCTGCGYVDHADLNAAKVLLTRANRSGLPMEGSVPKAARRSGKAVVRLRVPRRPLSQRA